MSKDMKLFSCESLRMTNAALLLAATLCLPSAAEAALGGGKNGASAAAAQAVQQSRTVTGTVVDESGEPMIGVTIRVSGQSGGTITDLDGKFKLNLPAGKNTLELTYTGYKSQKVTVSGSTVNVRMEPDAIGLDDVVVIGYGTVKKRDLTGAVTSVSSEDITLQPTANPLEALQGKVAGLDITRSSGQAGSGVDIQLRGTRSFTASGDPTIIIDGMPGNLATLNANDIESIDVLKDASSTAIYGSAGANGVIIVTTKNGKAGKTKVDFNAYLGINGWSKVPSVRDADSYYNLRKLAQEEAGQYVDEVSVLGSQEAYDAYKAGQSIDWADELLKTGVTQNYSVSVSGGTERTKAYMSLNFTNENGQYDNDNYKVYSTNIRVDHQLKNWLAIGVNMQGSYVYKNSAYSKLINLLTENPIGQLYDDEGNVNITPIAGDTSFISLLANNHSNYRNNNQVTRVYLNPYIRITPLKGLTFESRLNASLSYNKTNRFEGIGSYQYYNASGYDVQGTNDKVWASVAQTNNANYKWENILSYNFNINEDHEFTLTGVTSWNHNRQEYTYAYADNLTTNTYLWHYLGSGQNQKAQSSYTMSKGLGFVGRVNYSYQGKYLAAASVRYDGSSRLAAGNRWDVFPAFSAGWRISEEPFMKSTRSWLDNLKFRVGYGVTGTAAIDEYSSISTAEQSYLGLGQEKLTSYKFSKIVANLGLGWEKSKSWNFGLDASILNGRVDLTLDYYITNTDDVIWSKNLPATIGQYDASTPYQTNMNICATKNRGIEIAINSRNIVTKDFTWTTNLTFNHNKEKIKKLATASTDPVVNGDYALALGEAVNSFYSYKLEGTWKTSEADDAAVFGQKPGDLKINIPGLIHDGTGKYSKWQDVENEETGEVEHKLVHYDADETTEDADLYTISANDKQILGHKNPDWTMGLKNTFTYKGFDLSVYLYWRWGQMINYDLLGYYTPSGSGNFPEYFDYWTTATGDKNHYYPALRSGVKLSDYIGWDGLAYVDGSFFKVKNITLGYTLPKKALKAIGIDNLRVYTTLTNPLVIAKSDMLKDYDPEMAGSIDYPLTKQFVFGINLTF